MAGLIWITGLSASGKTSLAKTVHDVVIKEFGVNPVMLDGDDLRKIFDEEGGHTPEERRAFAHQYSDLCKLFVDQGHLVICSTISMFEEVRAKNRKNNDHYCEVFIDVEDDIRIKRRDVGSLTKAEICDPSSPFQLPANPTFTFTNTDPEHLFENAARIINFIRGWSNGLHLNHAAR